MSDHDHEHRCDVHAYQEGVPTPAQDLAIARTALERDRDPRHALHHVACAIAIDPEMPEALALADRIFDSMSDPLALFATGGTRYYGEVALRALVLRRMGRIEEALDLLLAVIGTRPDVPFTRWLERWTDEATLRAISPELLARSIQGALARLENAPVEPRLRELAHGPLAVLSRRALAVHPEHAMLAIIASRAVRIAGHTEEAIAIARAVDARSPTFMSAVILGGALRVAGDPEGALAAFREALARDPDALDVRLDIGDMLIELRRWDAAVTAYDEVLARAPDDGWALPSMLYARWVVRGEPDDRDRLEELAEHETDPRGRARALCDAITPYLGYLPGRGEAVIAAVTRDDVSAGATVTLESLEAPSAISVAEDVARIRWGAAIPIAVASVPAPDPRRPRAPVSFELWRYEGTRAVPAQAPASDAIQRVVADLAARRFHVIEWTRAAQRVGPRLGAVAIEPLLGAMVHGVSPTPDAITPWDWRFRAQVAAALVLAFVDAGWAESGRRRALLSLVHGPLDWTTTAAIVALTQLAHEEPLAREEIDRTFDEIARLPHSPIALWCAIAPVAHCRLQLPGLDDATLAYFRAVRAEIERG